MERMESVRKMLAFFIGLLIVIVGVMDDCPRVGAITIGLLLSGIFTVPEAIGIIRGKNVTGSEEK